MKTQNKIINSLTQWKVIIPLGVIVLGWFFWPQINPVKVQKTNTSNTESSISGQTKQPVSATSLFGVNKKLRCSIESATAVIDDTKIAATYNENKKQNRVIFDGDCLYRWTNGSSNGERSCGLKSYIALVPQFVSNDSLEKLFPQVNELTATCKEIAVVDQKVFEAPKTVLFKNKKLF